MAGPRPLVLRVEDTQRVPLQGQELEQYMVQQGQVAVEVHEDMGVEEEEEEEQEERADEGGGGGRAMEAEMEAELIGEGILMQGGGGSGAGGPFASSGSIVMGIAGGNSLALRPSLPLSSTYGSLMLLGGDVDGQLGAEAEVLLECFEVPKVRE